MRTSLSLLAVLAAVAVLAQAAPLDAKQGPAQNAVCQTEQCKNTGSRMLTSMDKTADPCVDFHVYACGGYDKKRDIPADKSSIGLFDDVDEDNVLVQRDILEGKAPAIKDPKDQQTFRKMTDLYKSCMDTSRIAAQGIAPLRQLVDSLGKALDVADDKAADKVDYNKLADALAQLHLLGADTLVGIGVGADDKAPEKQTIFMSQSDLSLPTKEYYQDDKNLGVLESAISGMLKQLSPQSNTDWAAAAKDVVALEKRLSAIQLSPDQMRDPVATYNPYTVDKLSELLPGFPWAKLLNTVLTATKTPVSLDKLVSPIIVSTPSYFKDLAGVLGTASPKTLHNYFVWQVVSAFARRLDIKAREPYNQLWELLTGVKADVEPPRWKTCVGATNSVLGFAAARWFVERRFGSDSRDRATAMLKDVINTYIARLDELDWLDAPTRQLAKDKARAVGMRIGFPDFIFDANKLAAYYDMLAIDPTNYFNNRVSAARTSVARNWNQLGKPTDKTQWSSLPQDVNAFYSPSQNDITFLAGYLQPPFFQAGLPDAINFGAAGVVMGHELSHGFDDQGRHYDAGGSLKDWWSDKTVQEFTKRTQCFVDQYSKFSIQGPDGKSVNINGKLTLGENIADNGGLRQSFSTFTKRRAAQPQQKLPGLEQLTDEQLFFLSYGQSWCGKSRPEAMVSQVLSDPHSPDFVRINAVVQNSPSFAQAFQCKQGSPMNPANKCELW